MISCNGLNTALLKDISLMPVNTYAIWYDVTLTSH